MGSRHLKRWLSRPLRDHKLINKRLAAINEIINKKEINPIKDFLKQTHDIERIHARIALKSARPRDLIHLRDTLAILEPLRNLLSHFESELIAEARFHIKPLPHLHQLIKSAIVENPPTHLRDGNVIAEGFDEELDGFRLLNQHASEKLLIMEAEERERTKLSTLKICFNRVQGYFIELSKSQASRFPLIIRDNKL